MAQAVFLLSGVFPRWWIKADYKQKISRKWVGKPHFRLIFGRSGRIRTDGIEVPNFARYQLRHTRLYLNLTCFPLIGFLLIRRGASFRNIVAVLRLERSFRSLFLHLGAMPSSATGGGISPRPAAPHPESSSIIPQEKRFDKSFSKLF